MKIDVLEQQLYIDEKRVETHFPVKKALSYEGAVVVLLKPSSEKANRQNVLCYTPNGVLKWKIQASSYKGSEPDPYLRIWVDKEKLHAATWFGLTHLVDAKSGYISTANFERF